MNRRDALRSLALVTGGLVLVPSCDFSQEDILEAYDRLKVTPSMKSLLAKIADTIIPPGEIKGAADLEVPDFILVMVNDCLDENAQKSFMNGFNGFEDYAKSKSGSAFGELDNKQREEVVLTGLQEESEDKNELRAFLGTTKRFTVQGFLLSEYIQTEIKPYSLIPGDYQGEVLISSLNSEKING
ncbi:gluconate 2-dehydrogenase subunit 3 family protein [Arthrospiribacter ruber]|uniref:Gluconate 2-dehydrogenase subunit 3 family protein n=1 Tax=Arthrospiribacter ruber TaxID=2487934 RepID=A0A951IX53_9BACT|nr:gluconate 2-dehydrogenase subunit 3 family protein [Arthrospiribacter ruber]MBW3467446.1 gluconate 2-dehydrogenase subunit 3 family protein [Arthrospiribacter ruber]